MPRPRASTAALAALLLAAPAAAQPAPRPHRPRAVVEQLILQAIGGVPYYLDSGDKDFDYRGLNGTWAGWADRLSGRQTRFDDNALVLNVGHGLSGAYYYQFARANELGPLESLALAAASSTLWEVAWEFQEVVSVNDLIVTPLGGMTLGEVLYQLGEHLHAGGRAPARAALALLASPGRVIHDAVDGAPPAPPRDVPHRFELVASAGATSRTRDEAGVAEPEVALSLSTEILALPGFGRAGRRRRAFADGNLTRLDVVFAAGPAGFHEFGLRASATYAGLAWQDLRGDGRPRGTAAVVGPSTALEVDLAALGAGATDRVVLLGGGPLVDACVTGGAWRLRVGAEALVDFAMVQSLAFGRYARAHGVDGVRSVLVNEGYYHAVGATLRAAVDLDLGPVAVAARVQYDALASIDGLDRAVQGPTRDFPLADQRLRVGLRVGASPAAGAAPSVALEYTRRAGSAAEAAADRDDVRVLGELRLAL